MFGKKDGDDAGGSGERESVSSGLTMLHQAMLHTGTTLSESLEQGLAEVKKSNAAGHTRIAGEISSMTKVLQQTKDLLPLSYPGRDTATAEEVQRLGGLVEGMQAALDDMMRTVTASLPVLVPAAVGTAESSGQDTAAVGTVYDGASVLSAVPEQRTDSAGPPAAAASAPAEDTNKSAEAEAGPEVETGPGNEAGPAAEGAREVTLTRDELAEAVREVLAQETQTPLTRDQVCDAVREVLTPLITALPPAPADDTLPAVAELGEQIAALRAEIAGLAERLPSTQQDEDAEEQERPVPDPGHSKVLTQAAGISSAVLVCHRDLWELLSGWAGGHPHFRMPPHITDQGENRIAADISGRSLIAVLISLAALRHTATEGDGDRELAGAVYQRISDNLASLSPDNGPLATITLDDRSPHTPDNGDGTDGDTTSSA